MPITTSPRRLFRPTDVLSIRSGSLIRFRYLRWKHAPNPLVIISDILPDGDIRGVNLQYLTLNYVVNLVRDYCDKQGFSYRSLMGNPYLVSGFRRYKRFAIQGLELVDCELLLNIIDMMRTRDPNQEKALREEAQRQIQRQITQPAEELIDEGASVMGDEGVPVTGEAPMGEGE